MPDQALDKCKSCKRESNEFIEKGFIEKELLNFCMKKIKFEKLALDMKFKT